MAGPFCSPQHSHSPVILMGKSRLALLETQVACSLAGSSHCTFLCQAEREEHEGTVYQTKSMWGNGYSIRSMSISVRSSRAGIPERKPVALEIHVLKNPSAVSRCGTRIISMIGSTPNSFSWRSCDSVIPSVKRTIRSPALSRAFSTANSSLQKRPSGNPVESKDHTFVSCARSGARCPALQSSIFPLA